MTTPPSPDAVWTTCCERRALYEAAKNASHQRSPDHGYYAAVKHRHDGKLAAISMARKLARRCYHTLRNLDPEIVYAKAPASSKTTFRVSPVPGARRPSP
jgi:hypothetical protein